MLNFGDHVHYFIPGHGGPGGYAYVAGEMSYSDRGSHVLLVNENEIGMPIHSAHCSAIGSNEAERVAVWRDRYLLRWPHALKTIQVVSGTYLTKPTT